MFAAVLLATAFAATAQAQSTARPIQPLGEFSNMRFTEDHAYGYAVQLWRDGPSVIGLLLVAEGPPSDTPAGLLEHVTFDTRTGALAFTARLTTGEQLLSGGGQQPSRDLFVFTGTVRRGELAGTMKRSDAAQPSRPASSERIRLRKQTEMPFPRAATYEEWKRGIDEILKSRGPRW